MSGEGQGQGEGSGQALEAGSERHRGPVPITIAHRGPVPIYHSPRVCPYHYHSPRACPYLSLTEGLSLSLSSSGRELAKLPTELTWPGSGVRVRR